MLFVQISIQATLQVYILCPTDAIPVSGVNNIMRQKVWHGVSHFVTKRGGGEPLGEEIIKSTCLKQCWRLERYTITRSWEEEEDEEEKKKRGGETTAKEVENV